MRTLVLGAQGQLGTELLKAGVGRTLITHTRFDADITDVPALSRFVHEAKPDWILNTVAFNQTELCEDEPGVALAINSLAPRALAKMAGEIGARLVHFSTDFVFDGAKSSPYVESDVPAPINLYGFSKFGGERFVIAASDKNIVIRTASLYGRMGSRAKGGNFVDKILAKARAGEPLQVVSDIVMSPTSAADLAEKVWELVDLKVPGGLYHLANQGQASWWDFATEILALSGLSVPVEKVSRQAFPSKLRRAPYTALASERLPTLGLLPLRPWRDALSSYLRDKA